MDFFQYTKSQAKTQAKTVPWESGPRCEFCAGERQRRDRERFAKLERVEPIFEVVEEEENELEDSRVVFKKNFS